jgi:uncharacterized membrane protein
MIAAPVNFGEWFMQVSQFHYLPMRPVFFSFLIGVFFILLIVADVTNLDKVRGLGAPIASIGGAGTFDGIFLTGILATLLASLVSRPRTAATT